MLDLAKATGDADLLVAGHATGCACYVWAGEFAMALEHAGKVIDLYNDEKHRHLADILNQISRPRLTLAFDFLSGFWATRTGRCG